MTSNKPSTKPPKSSVAPSLSDDGTPPPWLSNLVSPTPDHHRDIPTGCSDPSAGAVFLTKLIRLDTTRAFRALCDDPAVTVEELEKELERLKTLGAVPRNVQQVA